MPVSPRPLRTSPITTPMRIAFPSVLFLSSLVTAQDKAAAKPIDFEKQVWPILEASCVKCHQTAHAGPDGKLKKPKGGVTLDSKDGMLASKKGKLLVAKKPDESKLYESITLAADHEDRMPPPKEGDVLAKEKTELIKKWIEEGAAFGSWTGKKADDKDKKNETNAKDGDKPKGAGAEKPKGPNGG
jgi:uncharacterized membrane protein